MRGPWPAGQACERFEPRIDQSKGKCCAELCWLRVLKPWQHICPVSVGADFYALPKTVLKAITLPAQSILERWSLSQPSFVRISGSIYFDQEDLLTPQLFLLHLRCLTYLSRLVRTWVGNNSERTIFQEFAESLDNQSVLPTAAWCVWWKLIHYVTQGPMTKSEPCWKAAKIPLFFLKKQGAAFPLLDTLAHSVPENIERKNFRRFVNHQIWSVQVHDFFGLGCASIATTGLLSC